MGSNSSKLQGNFSYAKMNFWAPIRKIDQLHKSYLRYLPKIPKFTWVTTTSSPKNSTLSCKTTTNEAIVPKAVGKAYSTPMSIGSNYNKIPMILRPSSTSSMRSKQDLLGSISWILDLYVPIMSNCPTLERRIIHRWELKRRSWEGRRRNRWLLRDWQYSLIILRFILPFPIRLLDKNLQWEPRK